MKKKVLFIITLLMMCLAVQGYAQDRQGHRGHRTEQQNKGERRSGYSRSRENNSHRNRERIAPTKATQRSHDRYNKEQNRNNRHSGYSRSRENNNHRNYERTTPQRTRDSYQHSSSNRKHDGRGDRSRYTPPPKHHGSPHHYRKPAPPPRYRHHHNFYHHSHHCHFADWYWYNWGGYRNRFICHRHYHNRFFDSMLGYYLWGALNAPERLDIGGLSLTRYNSLLKIQNNREYSYIDLYTSQTILYQVGNTMVEISAGNGYATIRFYDEYGNDAVYTL